MNEPASHILALLQKQAHMDYIGEPVSQLEHALQCAGLAEEAGAGETLILAALLHDIGHSCSPGAETMADVGVRHHESLGASYLDDLGLNPEIGELVRNHVNAKRYLVQRNPEYAAKLSPASTTTLKHQGGPMTEVEAAQFEQHPRFKQILQLRAWDEAAKAPQNSSLPMDRYAAMIRRNTAPLLNAAQRAVWRQQGCLKISDWLSPTEVTLLQTRVTELMAWPETAGRWMQYFEASDGARQLCRIENFIQYQNDLNEICSSHQTLALLAALFEEPARLFKEKINFKLPGGQGFKPHQDAPAFTSFGHSYHITMMLSIDASTSDNGCLETASGGRDRSLLKTADDLTIDPDTAADLDWSPIPTEPGDLLLFDSYLPHRSGPNNTHQPRRALYATYHPAADGDVREEYFARKRASFPPDVEREPGKAYDGGVFNVGNPVTTGRR